LALVSGTPAGAAALFLDALMALGMVLKKATAA
jgi:hypothetical protein